MANTLEYSKIFQPVLDKQIAQESTTGWMEVNSSQVKYNGGDEVKLPNILMDGLGDYDRNKGYVDGSVSMKWDTYKLSQDRGRKFQLDAMDVDETNFVATAGTVMGEFQRTQVVPEIDAYRYSKIASLAKEASNSRDLTITSTNILDELLQDLTVLEDKIGAQQVIITLSPITAGILKKAAKDLITAQTFSQAGLNLNVSAFNENPLKTVTSKLLKSKYVFKDGSTSGQETGGFEADASAQDINWLLSTSDAPIAISKTDVVRVFDPLTNQTANAWKMDYRKYHDLWIPKNKLDKVYANLKKAETTPPEGSGD